MEDNLPEMGEKLPEYDPRLRECANKIKALLKEYDVAGVVVLQCPTHTENLVRVDPSYSCAKIVNDQFSIHEPIAAAGDSERRALTITQTVNMLNNLRFVTQKLFLSLTGAQNQFMQHFNIKMPGPKKVNGNRIIRPGT